MNFSHLLRSHAAEKIDVCVCSRNASTAASYEGIERLLVLAGAEKLFFRASGRVNNAPVPLNRLTAESEIMLRMDAWITVIYLGVIRMGRFLDSVSEPICQKASARDCSKKADVVEPI
jgi:hypothetical protein